MRAKNKVMTYGLVFLIAINITALLTLAYNRWYVQEKSSQTSGPARIVESVRKELNLTVHQAHKMIDHRNSYQQQIKPEMLKIQEKKRQLFDELRSEKPDQSLINSFIDEISLLQAEIQKKAVKNFLKEKSILDKNQQKHYFSMCEQHVCGQGKGAAHSHGKSSSIRGKMENKESPSCLNKILNH
jgi:Spy/CpxP family protein refolding chaperone